MIPDAVKIRWQEFYAHEGQGRLKSPAELRKVFERAGVADQTVVTYCAVGMRAIKLRVAQRHHWVHPHRPPRGQVAGEERDRGEHAGHARERRDVPRVHLVEKGLDRS